MWPCWKIRTIAGHGGKSNLLKPPNIWPYLTYTKFTTNGATLKLLKPPNILQCLKIPQNCRPRGKFWVTPCCGQGTCSLLQRRRCERHLRWSEDIEMSQSKTSIQEVKSIDQQIEMPTKPENSTKEPKNETTRASTDSLNSIHLVHFFFWSAGARDVRDRSRRS